MSDPIQERIANATKTLMQTHPFSQVTVTSIMQSAELRRQTFYDYFTDKYAVLEWIYQEEISAVIQGHLQYHNWASTLKQVLTYFDDNREFYRVAFPTQEQNALRQAVTAHVERLVEVVLDDFPELQAIDLPAMDRRFLVITLAAGLVMALSFWFVAPNPRSVEEEQRLIQTYVEDLINGMLLRSNPDYQYRHQDAD